MTIVLPFHFFSLGLVWICMMATRYGGTQNSGLEKRTPWAVDISVVLSLLLAGYQPAEVMGSRPG
jgi:hypothetical protein